MISGPNRHYIPQILLRGFGKPTKSGKWTQVVAYFQNGKAVSTNTKNVGASRNFYPYGLDKKITDYENKKLDNILRRFRHTSVGEQVDAGEASELVVHLTARQAEIIATTKLMTRLLMDVYMSETLWDKRSFKKIIGMHSRKHGVGKFMLDKFYSGPASKCFIRWRVPKIVLDFILLYIARRVLDKDIQSLLSEHRTSFSKTISEGDILSKVELVAHKSLMEFLDKTLVPKERLKTIKRFTWRIENAPAQTAVLPDCIALYSADGRHYASVRSVEQKKVIAVYMPITYDKVLVGHKSRKQEIPPNINRMAAECSSMFFIARDIKDEFVPMTRIIGAKTSAIIEQAIRLALKKKDMRQIRSAMEKRALISFKKYLDSIAKD